MDWLSFFRIVGYGAIIFGVISTIAVDILKNREDKANELVQQKQMKELSNDVKMANVRLEPFAQMAKELYPSMNQKDALAQLAKRIDSADQAIIETKKHADTINKELDKEKKSIKTFAVNVLVKFSGTWDKQPYPTWYMPPSPKTFVTWIDRTKKLPDIEFAATRINYEVVNASTGIFKNTLVVREGSYPLGELTDILHNYDDMVCRLLFTQPANMKNAVVTFEEVHFEFFINGKKRGELHQTSPMTVDYSESLEMLRTNPNLQLNPEITLNGKPVDIFKFDL